MCHFPSDNFAKVRLGLPGGALRLEQDRNRTLRLRQTWEVAAWEVTTWENFFGKVPEILEITLHSTNF